MHIVYIHAFKHDCVSKVYMWMGSFAIKEATNKATFAYKPQCGQGQCHSQKCGRHLCWLRSCSIMVSTQRFPCLQGRLIYFYWLQNTNDTALVWTHLTSLYMYTVCIMIIILCWVLCWSFTLITYTSIYCYGALSTVLLRRCSCARCPNDGVPMIALVYGAST